MKSVCRFGLFVLLSSVGLGGFSNDVRAQAANANLPDGPSPPGNSAEPAPAADRQAFDPSSEREATWRTLPRNFLRDQKDIWLFPTQLARGRHWVPTLAVAGITAGLIYADPHTMPYFRKHATNWDDFNDTFDAYITTGEVISLPAGLLAGGYIRHDPRTVSSALLCAQAYGDSAIVDLAIKAITRRERPVDVPVNGNYRDTFFNGGKSPLHGSSFPSGHTIGVFSVATVVANRYQRHRWVPFAAYGMAFVISASRITTAAHWPSDVFLGGALGYSIAKYETLRPQ